MNLLEQLKERLRHHQPQSLSLDYPEAGVLVAVTNDVANPEIILTKRSDQLSTHSGQVAFPGGRRDDTDESILVTALRESEEEVALPPAAVDVVGQLSQVVSRFGIVVTPIVGIVPSHIQLRANPDELDAVFNVPLHFLLRDERIRTDVISFKGVTYHVPCYQFEQYEIWGLSAIILVDLLNTAFDAGIQLLGNRG